MSEFPLWFNPEEYADFITESVLLFEVNIPLQKQKAENRKKMMEFDRQISLRRNNLRMELMRDAGRAKAKGIQMGLGEQFKQSLLDDFYSYLLEAKTPIKAEKHKMRPEVDPAHRERNRKREARRQEKQEGLRNILIVKNKKINRIEIIQKSDFDPKSHELIKGKTKKMDKGSVTVEDLKKYANRSDFRNTKTSIRLLGRIGEVEQKEQQDEQDYQEQTGGKGSSNDGQEAPPPPPPPRPRVPTNGKEMTDIDSTYPDWDHSSDNLIVGIPEMLNTLQGVEMSPELQQAMTDSRTLGEALNRFLKQFIKEFPAAINYKYEIPKKPFPTGKLWSAMGIKEAVSRATLYAIGKKKDDKIGFNVKIGKQYRPTNPGEAGPIFNAVLQAVDPSKTIPIFKMLMSNFQENIKEKLSKPINRPTFDNKNKAFAELEKQEWELETSTSRTALFGTKCRGILEDLLNREPSLKSTFITEALMGNIQFEGGDGSASHLICLNKDGSNTKVIEINPEFINQLIKSIEFVIRFGTVPIPPESPANKIIQDIGKLNEDANVSGALDSFEQLLQQLPDIPSFMQVFGITVEDITFKSGVDYSDYSFKTVNNTNLVTFDPGTGVEKEVSIPVELNYSPMGDEENVIEKGADHLLEEYLLLNDYLVEEIKHNHLDLNEALETLNSEFNILEERNYRKEYDNYHSKPKQRANRSKRVLARRKLEKEGRVKKGDDKDVDHKDGNPQNNSDDNLRVLSKSKNRSMNESCGGGFIGTTKLLKKFLKNTPGATNPVEELPEVDYVEDPYVNDDE